MAEKVKVYKDDLNNPSTKLSVDEILKNGSLLRDMKTVTSYTKLSKQLNAFITDPTSAIPKAFRTKDDVTAFIDAFKRNLGKAGIVDKQLILSALNKITKDRVEGEVAIMRAKLTTNRGIPVKLTNEQTEMLSGALEKFSRGLEIAVTHSDLYYELLGEKRPEVVAEKAEQLVESESE